MKRASKIGVAVLLSFAVAPAANADRYPTKSERSSIVGVLKANGYVRWSEIELDDGRWEVDDAIHRNGKRYDLKIKRGRIVHRERDWD